MARYRRVNIDGKSITETRTTAATLQPGTFVVIDANDKFAQAAAVTGRMYVLNPAYHQGLDIATAIPSGDSAVADYVEEARELAVRVGPGTYKKDQPITVNASGVAASVPAAAGTYQVIGYSQDDAVVASGATDFLRIRIRASSVTNA